MSKIVPAKEAAELTLSIICYNLQCTSSVPRSKLKCEHVQKRETKPTTLYVTYNK